MVEGAYEPTDWVNAVACSRKKRGKLKIYLGPKPLNTFIKRMYNKTPTLEEISNKLAGAKHFTKLDAKHGYWAIHSDEEYSMVTCFKTPLRKFKYLRFPFGLKLSQDIFQQKMDQVLVDCEEAIDIPDICVCGRTTTKHDKNLRKAMDTAQEYCLVFNKDRNGLSSMVLFGTQTVPTPIQKNATGSNQNQQTEKNSSNS